MTLSKLRVLKTADKQMDTEIQIYIDGPQFDVISIWNSEIWMKAYRMRCWWWWGRKFQHVYLCGFSCLQNSLFLSKNTKKKKRKDDSKLHRMSPKPETSLMSRKRECLTPKNAMQSRKAKQNITQLYSNERTALNTTKTSQILLNI